MIRGVPEELGGRAVCLFSAGKDSATSLRVAEARHDDAVPLFLHFGTDEADVNHGHVIGFFGGPSVGKREYELMWLNELLGPRFSREMEMREGVLNDSLDRDGELEEDVPYLPMRSMAIGTALAIAGDRLDADYLYWPFHQDEPLASLDESTSTLPIVESLIQETAPDGYDPVLVNPLHECEDGSEVIELGEEFSVEWQKTRSCLRVRDGHCWDCVSCEDRKSAFEQAGVTDPCYSLKK